MFQESNQLMDNTNN